MFKLPLTVDIDKKRKIIGLILFIFLTILIFVFQMLFNCQHQRNEYNKYLCKKKAYLPGDNIQNTFTDIKLTVNENFNYYGQNLSFIFNNPYYLYMTINSGIYGYTSFGGEVLINNISINIIKDGLPDSEQTFLWDKYINSFLNKTDVTYIYWDPVEYKLNITFINGTILNYNKNENIIKELIEKDFIRILKHPEFDFILSYSCTSCFNENEFKLENLWKVLVGFGTMTFTVYNILLFILSRGIKYNTDNNYSLNVETLTQENLKN